LIDISTALIALGLYGMVNLLVGIFVGHWFGRPTPPPPKRDPRTKG